MVMQMKVFYLDSFLLLNLVLDYLLLLLTANLTGVCTKRRKILFAALFGAVFATWMFFFSGGAFITFLLNCFAGWIMILLSFRLTSLRKRLRIYGVFLIQSLGFSGLMSLLQTMGMGRIAVQNGVTYIQMELWQLIVSAVGGYIIFRICFRDHGLKLEKKRIHLQVKLGETSVQTLVLVDSGNLLREPISGKPVILLAPEIMEKLLPEEAVNILQQEYWDQSSVMEILMKKNIVARLLPFQTMGEKCCFTLAVKPDTITLNMEGKVRKTTDYWIGIARNDIDVCGGCRGLIGV